jgi:hypothetical protein
VSPSTQRLLFLAAIWLSGIAGGNSGRLSPPLFFYVLIAL